MKKIGIGAVIYFAGRVLWFFLYLLKNAVFSILDLYASCALKTLQAVSLNPIIAL